MEDGEEAFEGEGLGAEEVARDLATTRGGSVGGGEGLTVLAPTPAGGMLG